MKKIILACFAIVVMLAGCKTTEANYKSAYETAKEKNAASGGLGAIDSELAAEDSPKEIKIGDVQLPVINCRLYKATTEGDDAIVPKLYNVAVAKFRQRFNARSLCQRLRDGGFDGAFVAIDMEKNYYVMTGTTDDASEASTLLSATESSDVFRAKSPFPCVIVSLR